MVASPVPQIALTRRRTYCDAITCGFSTTIGATTGPVRGNAFPFASGGLGGSAAGLPGLAAGRGGGGSLKYFNAKSETMSRFSDTFAFNWNDASCGIDKITSPVIFVKP